MPRTADEPALTAYPATEKWLREHFADAPADRRAFERRLTRCSLAECRGMCCYDGVYVEQQTAEGLRALAAERADDFRAMGLELPDEVIVPGEWRGEAAGLKTAVKPWPFRALTPGFPAHFEETACVFHLADGRCALQVLAEEEGSHPWTYKPFTCWLHPISLGPEGITVHDELTDPHRLPGYDGYVTETFCGRTEACGRPAHQVLREELEFLGSILGRDLAGEVGGGGGPHEE